MAIGQQFSAMQQETPDACLPDITPPTGGAISTLTNNTDGSVRAAWAAATDSNGPITYAVFIQKATATGIFSTTPFMTQGLLLDMYRDALGNAIVQGETIFAAVRAIDALGNVNTNTTTTSVVATGIGYANLLSVIPAAVWDVATASHVIAGSFGLGFADIKTKTDQFSFTGANVNAIAQVVSDKTGYALTAGERTAIAVAVEAALLNDGDGQALLAAIATAIGNQNVNEIALVAAIRADIERVGGMLISKAAQTTADAIKTNTNLIPAAL